MADNFFNSGYDVVISGIDTTEALVEAGKMAAAGKKVWAIPYDYAGSLAEAPTVALGVPYFNWGPAYLKAVTMASQGKWTSYWDWNGPDWKDINNADTSAVGFVQGEALTGDAKAKVDQFITELAGGLNLWKGPINLQDGTAVPEGRRSRHRSADLVPAPASRGHGRPERRQVGPTELHKHVTPKGETVPVSPFWFP